VNVPHWCFDGPQLITVLSTATLVFLLLAFANSQSIFAWCLVLVGTSALLAWIGCWIIHDVQRHPEGYD
jgi:hypothetical protein